jgi:hypothetical protein
VNTAARTNHFKKWIPVRNFARIAANYIGAGYVPLISMRMNIATARIVRLSAIVSPLRITVSERVKQGVISISG